MGAAHGTNGEIRMYSPQPAIRHPRQPGQEDLSMRDPILLLSGTGVVAVAIALGIALTGGGSRTGYGWPPLGACRLCGRGGCRS